MLAIEIDGITHDHPEKFLHDKTRQKSIEALGVTFARIEDIEVKQNMHGVLTYLDSFIRRLKAE
jgi:very-short-patch-repair endonuclease